MTPRLLFTVLALLGMGGTALAVDDAPVSPSTPSDSALDELGAGRFWHAATLLRVEGVAEGNPADILVLAEAEAGWHNWAGVLELLEHAEWLDQFEGGRPHYLLGRALESAEQWEEASRAFQDAARAFGHRSAAGIAALARSARVERNSGDVDGALVTIGLIETSAPVRSWIATELLLAAAQDGDVTTVGALSTYVVGPEALATIWRAEVDALLNSGDSAAAAKALRTLASTGSEDRRRLATVELGLLLLAAGDSVEARSLLSASLSTPASLGSRAAAALVDLGGGGLDSTLGMARILDRTGDGQRALRAYDRAAALTRENGSQLPESARLERARIMATVPERQAEALDEFRAIRESTQSSRIGARNLDLWARLRSRQGLDSEVSTLRRWLVEEYPGSSEAVEVIWNQGRNAESSGQYDVALGHYAMLSENAPTHSRAGEARMRSGQIYLGRSDLESAATVFEQYLEDFPNGRRWQEAAYWAGRVRLDLGDELAGTRHLSRVLGQPISYYAVMAADELGAPFEVDVPPGVTPVEPEWMTEALARLDLLTEAGLERGAAAEIAALTSRARERTAEALRLAGALIERGRTIDGINHGWALLEESGNQWDRELLRVTYPFPYQELVRREAEEWGLDPLMLAALIRQESAFKTDIVSRAGAIGLMQVMPPTGAQLARAHGPSGFSEESLTTPEVNLHLGSAFFVEMSARYDGDLPLVLSAYNAGPTRANRWRLYPEASDALRFTERIPFVETRGYVKNVRRNLGLYRILYGQD